jgi:ABC-type amino acid transport substrate-binding protein
MNRRQTAFPASVVIFVLTFAQFAGAIAEVQQTSDPRVADLVRTGKLRVGIGLANLGSAIKDPATGELRGIAADLARALAARIRRGFGSRYRGGMRSTSL